MSRLRITHCMAHFALYALCFLVLLVACVETPAPTHTVDPGTPTASLTPPVSPISPLATLTPPLPATATALPPTATLTALPPTATATPVPPTAPVSPLPTVVSPLPIPLLPQSGEPVNSYGMELSGTGLAAIVALLTSLMLAYVPGFQGWWESYPHKRESLAGVGFLLAWVLVGLHYAGAVDLGLGAFGWPVIWRALEAWLAFAGMGQLSFTAQKWNRNS